MNTATLIGIGFAFAGVVITGTACLCDWAYKLGRADEAREQLEMFEEFMRERRGPDWKSKHEYGELSRFCRHCGVEIEHASSSVCSGRKEGA